MRTPSEDGQARMTRVELKWQCFRKLTEARESFSHEPCIYVQTDKDSAPVRIGKASQGLRARYRGGTGYALDAAMHQSGNKVFVAGVSATLCDDVERQLIWQLRASLPYNIQGKRRPPATGIRLLHRGSMPSFPTD